MSVAVALTLGLVLAGLQPLVVRSASMEPTYSVGDVVLVANEQVGDLRSGEVVTRYDAPQARDSLTHRVTELSREGDVVQVATRGDANDTGETWSAPANRQVGVVVASMPAIGLPLTMVRTSTGWAVVLGLGVLAVLGVLLRPRRRSDPDDPTDDATQPAPGRADRISDSRTRRDADRRQRHDRRAAMTDDPTLDTPGDRPTGATPSRATTGLRAGVAAMLVGAVLVGVGVISTTSASDQPSCPGGSTAIARFDLLDGAYVAGVGECP